MGIIFVLIAGSLWGAMGIFVRGLASCGLSSIEICFVRVSVSALLLAGYFLVFNRSALKIKLKDIWCFLGTGVFSLTFFGYCYFTTIQMTSMSVAAVLLYTSPIFVLLLSAILFKEKITGKMAMCVVIAIAGCVFVSGIIGGESSVTALGFIIGLGSGLGYGLYSIFGRYAINRGYGALTITFYSFVFSALALLFLTNPVEIFRKLFYGNAGGAGIASVSQFTTGSSHSIYIILFYVIGTAIIVTILPYIFYTLGLTKVENSKAAVVACIEPIMASVLGFVVFHEIPGISEMIGIALVLAAIILLNFGSNDN